MKNILLLIFSVAIISCGTTRPPTKKTKGVDGESKIEFNILAVNDVYEIAALDNGKVGGMARIATLRDSLKRLNPNTFLMMAGDFLNPSLLGTLKFQGERIKGKQMIEVMNAMNFDLVTFGNHEFDLTPEKFQQRLNESNFEWVSANVQYVGSDIVVPFSKNLYGVRQAVPQTKTFTITNKNGYAAKLGIVSVTIDSNPREWVDYGDYLQDAEVAYTLIKDSVDVAIGFTHLNIEQDKALARMLPQLPLIIGGHEHDAVNEQVGETAIRKADANAKSAYLHNFTYDIKTKALTVESTLLPVDAKVPHQPAIKKIVDKWTAIQDREIKKVIDKPYEVIYNTKKLLDGTDASGRNQQTNLGNLITKGMSFAYNDDVDAVFVNGGSFRIDDELNGDISSFDIFRVLPFGGNLLRVKLTGQLLIEVLSYGEKSAGTGAYLQLLNLTKPQGSQQWFINDAPINPEGHYWIATSDFLLKGYDIPMLTEDNPGVIKIQTPKEDTLANDIRKAVIAYLKSLN